MHGFHPPYTASVERGGCGLSKFWHTQSLYFYGCRSYGQWWHMRENNRRLLDSHAFLSLNSVGVNADLRHICNDAVFNAGVRDGFQVSDGCHEARLSLGIESRCLYTLRASALSFLRTPQSIKIWRSVCFEAFLFPAILYNATCNFRQVKFQFPTLKRFP